MAAGDVKQFNLDLSNFLKDVNKFAEENFQNLAMRAHARVVQLTPFDTGRLMASWNLSVDVPDVRTAPLGQQSYSSAEGMALASSPNALNAKLGQTIYITNAVEYAIYVEDGSPTTRPYKMTAMTVMEVEQFIA